MADDFLATGDDLGFFNGLSNGSWLAMA